MSNESENKRIDLTQFDGTIAEGKWHEHILEPKEDGYERVASIVVSGVVAPPYTLQTNEGHTFATVEMGDLTAHLPLFMMVPDLIAELKRCYEHIDTLTAIWCNTCGKQFGKSDYGIKYHRITVPDDSLLYEYREDMQEHCIECIAPDESIEKNCICDLCYPSQE